ncbi:hypothetical protein B0H19DRAFT_1317621 [Mycena capillaripes]|nr:hypothetical protein B0H19DRAFT_1317621 [Mycena capillaripes]
MDAPRQDRLQSIDCSDCSDRRKDAFNSLILVAVDVGGLMNGELGRRFSQRRKGDEREERKRGNHRFKLSRRTELVASTPEDSLVLHSVNVSASVGPMVQRIVRTLRQVEGADIIGTRAEEVRCEATQGLVSVRPPSGAFTRAFLQRENVLFEEPFESDQYWRVMEAACFLPDLRILLGGDLTEVLAKRVYRASNNMGMPLRTSYILKEGGALPATALQAVAQVSTRTREPECRSRALRVGDIRKSGDRKQDVKPDAGKLQTAVHLRAPSRRQKFQGSWDSRYTEERGGAGRVTRPIVAQKYGSARAGAKIVVSSPTPLLLCRRLRSCAAAPTPLRGEASLGPSRALVQGVNCARRRQERETRLPDALRWRVQRQGDRGVSGGARGFAGGGGDEIRGWCSSTVFWGLNSRAVSYTIDGGSTLSASAHRRRVPNAFWRKSASTSGEASATAGGRGVSEGARGCVWWWCGGGGDDKHDKITDNLGHIAWRMQGSGKTLEIPHKEVEDFQESEQREFFRFGGITQVPFVGANIPKSLRLFPVNAEYSAHQPASWILYADQSARNGSAYRQHGLMTSRSPLFVSST